jgi:hypothetical protein
MLVDDIGGMYVTAIQALCTAREQDGYTLVAATDHFLFWRQSATP